MGGGTASGKSSLVKEMLNADPNQVHLDADKAQTYLPALAGLKEIDPEHAAERAYTEAKDLQRQCFDTCMNEIFAQSPSFSYGVKRKSP